MELSYNVNYYSSDHGMIGLEHTIHTPQLGDTQIFSSVKAEFNGEVNIFKAFVGSDDDKIHVVPFDNVEHRLNSYHIKEGMGELKQEDFVMEYETLFSKTMELFQNNDFVIHDKDKDASQIQAMKMALKSIGEKCNNKEQAPKFKLSDVIVPIYE